MIPASITLNALVISITRNGQLQPITTDSNGSILDGNLRLQACERVGVKPWIVERSNLTLSIRPDTFIRRQPSMLELATIAAGIRGEVAPDGARRAPSTGRIQEAVAEQMAERYGIDLSPRSAAYALQLSRLDARAQEAIAAIQPTSMKEALRAAEDHQLGEDTGESQVRPDRVQHLKRAHEFKAICSKLPVQALTEADIAMYDDLIDMLQRRKREWRSDASAR